MENVWDNQLVALVVFIPLAVFLLWRLRSHRSGSHDLPGFTPTDRLPSEMLKALPNPVQAGEELEADQNLPLMRRHTSRQRLQNRQTGVVGGLPAFAFDFSWQRARHQGFGSNIYTADTQYWSLVVVDLGVVQNFVAIRSEGPLDKMGKAVGRKDIDVGDAAFDRRFFVESQPTLVAERLLTTAVRSALMDSGLRGVDYYVRDRYFMVATRRPGRQRQMIEALPPIVSALRAGLPTQR